MPSAVARRPVGFVVHALAVLERESSSGGSDRESARACQVAVLRAHVADLIARAEVADAAAGSHAREATAQRERAERAEREAHSQRARADAREAERDRTQADLADTRRRLEGILGHPVIRAGSALRRLWRRRS